MSTQRKYKIQQHYELLPRAVSIVPQLKKVGISLRTFQRDKSMLINDDSDIPAERLRKYAQIFGVSIEDLFNYKTKAKAVVRTGLKAIALVIIASALTSCASYTCPTYSGAHTVHPYHVRR